MSSKDLEARATPYKAFVVLDAQVFPVTKSLTTIGRNLDNDLVIQNSQVSRVHAEIRYEDGEFVISDLNSTSGTFVNNLKIKKVKLYSGDLIRIAGIPMMFVDEKDPLYKEMEKRTDKLKKS